MNRRDYELAIQREVAEWPGVTLSFEEAGKHPRAVLTFGETSRFTPFPGTPSDSGRGLDIKVTEVRRMLREMGAVRNERAKSTRAPSERNPGADLREMPSSGPAPVVANPWEALPVLPRAPLITQAGAYPDIDAADYHRNPDLLPGPSLSSSGAKTLATKSPFHFWYDSPLNPDRPAEQQKTHFNVGKAAHDFILLRDRWPHAYHVLPEGFSRAKTKQMSDAIAEADAAEEAGLTILRFEDAETVRAVAAAIERSDIAMAALSNGVTEETLVWQDMLTGVWLRARPDFRPNSILTKRPVRIVADLKFVAPSHATPEGFRRAIHQFGYHQTAAFYSDGIKAVHDTVPTHWLHIVVENEAPYCVALYELPAEDIQRGRALNRSAITTFARCLSEDRWPGYADEPLQVGLPGWARHRIDTDLEQALSAAA